MKKGKGPNVSHVVPRRCSCGDVPEVRESVVDDFAVICKRRECSKHTKWHESKTIAIQSWNSGNLSTTPIFPPLRNAW